jgi:hypothetical protein
MTGLWEAAGWVHRRTMVGTVLPVLVFMCVVAVLVVADLGWRRVDALWRQAPLPIAVAVVIGLVVVTLAAAHLIGHHLVLLVRFFEGYWGTSRIVRPVVGWCIRRQRRRWRKITAAGHYSVRFHEFPVTEDDVLPTRFGNVFKAAETYVADRRRYGLDAVFFWSHLLQVIPKTTQTELASARASVETTVVVTTLSALLVPISAALGLGLGLPFVLWLSVVAGALLISRISYWTGVRSAIGFATLVRTAFDLHHRDLLHALGYEPPRTLEEERALWRAVGQTLYRRGADDDSLVVFVAYTKPEGSAN